MQRLVNVVIPPINQAFTYAVDPLIENELEIGSQVYVPFGRRRARAFIVSEASETTAKDLALKTIRAESKIRRCFDARDLQFFSWVAEYYGDNLANIIDVAIPNPVEEKIETYVRISADIDPQTIKAPAQRALYQYLKEQPQPAPLPLLRKFNRQATALVRKLNAAGFVEIDQREIIDQHVSHDKPPAWTKSDVELNNRQREALDVITKNIVQRSSTPILLHGVTGSGKTEVYIESIQHCLSSGMGALVMVPEIALTPQLIDRFRARLGDNIAVLHSALNRRVRWDSWRALLEQRNFVAIGARSSIFAPVPNLGLIIVDEEHDSSYKQSDGLRYHARDLAIMRAKILKCPVVLGSATPSLETFYHAVKKDYHYLPLPERHRVKDDGSDAPARMLSVEVIDLNRIRAKDMPSRNISPQLFHGIKETLAAEGQCFILYNRRGFATYLQCQSCDSVLECPNCSVTYTYHIKPSVHLLCHYCSSTVRPPLKCAACERKYGPQHATQLAQRGAGTEKVFDEIREFFPHANAARLDRDAVSSLQGYRKILSDVREGKTRILVGTQMIAKGHDLPGVTLVGIVDCDVGIHLPDFRSSERIFQLLTQAAGRAGRGAKAGRVLLQTRVAGHHSITMTKEQNFRRFAEIELRSRKLMNYPPFSRLVRIVAASENKDTGGAYLLTLKKRFEEILKDEMNKIIVLGPVQAPLEKIKNHWRWHMLVKGQSPTLLNKIVRIASAARGKTRKVKLVIDVDPQEMM